MSNREFTHILSSIPALSPDQVRQLYRELASRMAASPKPLDDALENAQRAPAEESVFDVMAKAGLIGCVQGMPGSPTDLSTNPSHMEGFGRG